MECAICGEDSGLTTIVFESTAGPANFRMHVCGGHAAHLAYALGAKTAELIAAKREPKPSRGPLPREPP